MGIVRVEEENMLETKLEWHSPSVISVGIEDITLGLGKLGSMFDGPGQPTVFDGE